MFDNDYNDLVEMFQEYQKPTIDVVFRLFEELPHDCLVYSQSGFIHIDHTVH